MKPFVGHEKGRGRAPQNVFSSNVRCLIRIFFRFVSYRDICIDESISFIYLSFMCMMDDLLSCIIIFHGLCF